MWPFRKKPKKPRERAAVRFGHDHVICNVRRDADDRPYVVICGRFIRLDSTDELEAKYRDVVWLERRPAQTENEGL